ncbi:MAG: ATP-binding protein [Verrucomicrobiota bacterium]
MHEAQERLSRHAEDLENQVTERTASLRETTEQLETFCYTIAHDLRSPLRAQQSFAQVLLDDYKDVLDETGRDYAHRIINSAKRLDKLVNDLLAYSRLSRNELKFESVDLNKILHDVQTGLAEEIRDKKARVAVGPLASVLAYEPTLNLVITNLMANALKFVGPGVAPQIKVWSEPHGKCVRLWIEDNGIGIHSENTEKIFGVFQRLHSMEKYPGTGIGLAIVRKGIERMDGSIGVESKLGEGSRFWIQLPRANS